MMKDILRIITPVEINDLTTTSDGENRIPLSEMLDDEVDRLDLITQGLASESEKILLFKKKRDFRAGTSCKRLFKFLGLENTENVSIVKNEKKRESSSNNIHKLKENNFLDAQDRLRESQRKLKSAEVLQLYKKSQDISVKKPSNCWAFGDITYLKQAGKYQRYR